MEGGKGSDGEGKGVDDRIELLVMERKCMGGESVEFVGRWVEEGGERASKVR